MKKELLLLVSTFFFLSMTAITGVYAVEENKKVVLISEDIEDVTGDGKKDKISLKGTRMDDSFYKDIFVEINTDEKEHKIDLEEGIRPSLNFNDFNQDGVKEIFISTETGASGGVSNYYLYTAKDNNIVNLKVPDPLVIQSQFLDGYKAKITIENNHKSYKFNLKNRSQDYENTGLYYQGKLNEPTELMIQSYTSLEPKKLRGKKLGLIGTQTISGAYNADVIGRVESTWELKNGTWTLIKTKIFETSYEKGRE